ncbi:hypothetical protein Plhal304r1_c024g0083291 [Plasmopara halstedii]
MPFCPNYGFEMRSYSRFSVTYNRSNESTLHRGDSVKRGVMNSFQLGSKGAFRTEMKP